MESKEQSRPTYANGPPRLTVYITNGEHKGTFSPIVKPIYATTTPIY